MSYIDGAAEVPAETFAGAHPSQRSWAPLYEAMGGHGSPAGISVAPTIIHVDSLISKFHSTEQTQRDSGNTHGHWVRPFLMCSELHPKSWTQNQLL